MNPLGMLSAVQNPEKLPCRKVKLKVGNVGKTKNKTQYVADQDIREIDPCNFNKNKNTITKKKCEKFSGSRSITDPNAVYNVNPINNENRKEFILQMYYSFVALLVAFLIYRTMVKKKLLTSDRRDISN